MKSRTLTKEHLPAFIFLIDLIENDRLGEEDNIYKTIAEYPTNPIHPRTIRRAFNLRENLRQGKMTNKDWNRPNRDALNALSYYYSEKKRFRFSDFERVNKDEIENYYQNNKPKNEIIDTVFSRPASTSKKLALLEEEIQELKKLLVELDGDTLEYFVEDFVDIRMERLFDRIGFEDTMKRLKVFVELKLEKSEKKLKRSSWLYRIFGGAGLIFMHTSQYDDIREYILECFADDQELEQQDNNQDFEDDDEDEDDDVF